MHSLQLLLENSNIPIVTAFLLGIVTTISPCPLAANITAIGYIGKDMDSRDRVFRQGILYTMGRVIGYTTLGAILIPILREGASLFAIQKEIAQYSEMLLAPSLILIGIFMLASHRLTLPKLGLTTASGSSLKTKGSWGALLLGVLFSLAFCPASGVLYFGVLIPMSAAESGGYMLPAIFAIATALPVIIAAWILAYSISGVGRFYNRMQWLQKWMNRLIALLFIGVGIYYLLLNYI